MQSITDAKSSQESTDNSPLNFAPFIVPEPSQFDYSPMIYDPLLSPTNFEWDTTNMWMPNFALDPVGLPADASIEYGEDYFNEDGNFNIMYQQGL